MKEEHLKIFSSVSSLNKNHSLFLFFFNIGAHSPSSNLRRTIEKNNTSFNLITKNNHSLIYDNILEYNTSFLAEVKKTTFSL